jgi:hypothetical protein
MEINRAAFGALAVIGVAAAGGGAYLANRDAAAVAQPAPVYAAPGPGAVIETENSIAVPPTAMVEPVPSAVAPSVVAAPDEPVRPANTARRASAPVRTPRAAERARSTPERRTQPPAPSSTPPSVAIDTPVSAAVEAPESTTVERHTAVQEPPRKAYDELVIPADSVIGLQVENAVSTERAKVEDPVRARVTRDVRVQDRVAIPAGARAEGSITLVERGGRLKDQARLGIRFHTIVLADGTRLPINTDTIYREGDSPARESAAKIGGAAVGGAVLGAILGGKKGAMIGSTVGAAGGGVAVATSQPDPATLPAGSTVTVRMGSPATVTVER